MNRLTRYDICLDVDMPVALNDGVTVDTAICTLAEYEDTGLSPKEVKKLVAQSKCEPKSIPPKSRRDNAKLQK